MERVRERAHNAISKAIVETNTKEHGYAYSCDIDVRNDYINQNYDSN